LKPEVYFKPNEVWEIRGADVTLSPVSIAAQGLVSQSRGLSLRFPRFITVREDKNTDQASSPEFLAQIWKDQQGKQSDQKGTDHGDLLDVELEEQVEEDDSDS
jgi:DNA ligase-1